ncbi:protein phosphatase 2C-like protein [Chitinophaga skermanii]|uniref:Protein phosphatase 2C-like protein n=1 Tax=Chitinophaga skermanii TaxID=331697 RepID=A0A327QX29_9BACT|nr:PP2C family serine/threonine-protein phosphatase [Chitinophaga skermanii]RAJ08284.1 protein phosphatase 2C-like protein [Chitinophaga skermanii]
MVEQFLQQLLTEFNIATSKYSDNTISRLLHHAKINELTKSITAAKKQAINIFQMYSVSEAFKDTPIILPNATAKQAYSFQFDLSAFPHTRIREIRLLDKVGLAFDPVTAQITGVPMVAITVDLQVVFTCGQDEDQAEDIKIIPLIVNADPKDLWLNKPSNKSALYAKEDSDRYAGTFLDKRIVVASQRGRSHAHEGSFRDDHFYTKPLLLGWEIIAVADGAGSAKFSREGSRIATTFIADSFNDEGVLKELSDRCTEYFTPTEEHSTEEQALKHKSAIINILYKSVRSLHTALSNFATQEQVQLKDLNTTLIFALVKKFEYGYVVLTFGVGDCPINVITENPHEVKLLNQLDIGEFGGGTRFITMPEIFTNEIVSRFAIHRFSDFSKLVLMTDGIYDPKFITENKLEDKAAWDMFWADLAGENEDQAKVDFLQPNGIDQQLLSWLDFWSKGNHDDRTLAIIY